MDAASYTNACMGSARPGECTSGVACSAPGRLGGPVTLVLWYTLRGDLVVVDGDARHVRAGHGRDGAHGPAHAASDVQARPAGAQAQDGGEAGLVRGLGGGPVLAGQARREVEALAPPPLVQVGH